MTTYVFLVLADIFVSSHLLAIANATGGIFAQDKGLSKASYLGAPQSPLLGGFTIHIT